MSSQPACEAVYCEDCDNVHLGTRRRPMRQWLCASYPRISPASQHVSRSKWAVQEPFLLCSECNADGACPKFKQMHVIGEDQ